MANESIKLGISFARDQIRFIEAEVWNGRFNLISIVQMPTPGPFDLTIIGDEKLIPRFSELLNNSLENFTDGVDSAGVCIDRRLALKKTFAVDKNLSEDAIRKHIEWELEQALIAPRDEYNVGFEHIVLPRSKNDVVVFAALRKAVVSYIDEIFKKSRLSLQTVDLDVFSSIRALGHAYGDKLNGVSALVEFWPTGVGYTILVDGMYAISTEKPVSNDDKKALIGDIPASELASIVNKEINRLVEYLEEELNISNLDRIFVAGEEADRAVVSELEKLQLSASVDFVEPFNNVHRQLNIESQMLIDEHAERFLSCFGMIL